MAETIKPDYGNCGSGSCHTAEARQSLPGGCDPTEAQKGCGKFPPLNASYLQNVLDDNDIDSTAFSVLIAECGYTLDQVKELWIGFHIRDKGVYIVATKGMSPPDDVVKWKYSAAIKVPAISAISDPASSGAADEVATQTSCPTSFVLNVPDGFDPALFIGEILLIDGQTLPSAISAQTAILTAHLLNHTIGSAKSDGSKDHTFTFQIRAETRAAALSAISANVLQFYVKGTVIRQ